MAYCLGKVSVREDDSQENQGERDWKADERLRAGKADRCKDCDEPGDGLDAGRLAPLQNAPLVKLSL